ncbi:hypothetical protein N7537_003626 [Penicillium hordei]|uniref:Uncharacterized protein n=1 Tax=Penicillium hordei TaxID=40994 RepID=A0AAD6E9Y8_9EURO|nr:uncharacterized protein N7537_003626 [Penicillium hordei]KAJ5607007.1 hypothetical protein N7537_003626 [Penicillium hordei]
MGTVFVALVCLGTKKCNVIELEMGDEEIELGELSQKNLEVCELEMGDETKELVESCQEIKKGLQCNNAEHENVVGG